MAKGNVRIRALAGPFLALAFCLAPLGADQSAPAAKAPRPYDEIVRRAARDASLPADLVHAVIAAESAYNPFAVSSKGAMGLMQLMVETAKSYGVRNIFDPEQNIRGGAMYLKNLLEYYRKLYPARRDTKELALAAYNAGQEAVRKYGGNVPNYPETKAYVKRITKAAPGDALKPKTVIYTYRDSQGRLVITNDSRLAASQGGEKPPEPQR